MNLITETKVSENLKHHLSNKIDLPDSTFRMGSKSWCALVNEVRELYLDGYLNLTEEEFELIKTDAGKIGIYENEEVPLDVPFAINESQYVVFVQNGDKIDKIIFS